MVAKESQVRLIGYGGMLMESFVAISALIAACVIDQGLYFAMNSPAGATGGTAEAAAAFVQGRGFDNTAEGTAAASAAVEEDRERVGEGKRVELSGGRILIKKKK